MAQGIMTNLLCLAFLASAAGTPYIARHPKIVYLIPVGKVEEDLMKELVQALRDKLGVNTKSGEQVEIPKVALDPRRNQYYSTRILQGLEKTKLYGRGQLLAVTEVDLFVPTLNFVFGEAIPEKDLAIISLCRLRQEFYGRPIDRTLLVERMLKEAVHEIGHVWGMRHCSNPNCVMFFSNSLADTDRKSNTFCEHCKRRLNDNIQR